MAEELGSKLGFDVSQAVSALSQLKRQLDSYTASLEKSAGGAANFNTDQAKVDKLLISGAAAAEKAASGLKSFASSQSAAARGTSNLSNQLDTLNKKFASLSITQSKNAASAGRTGQAGAGPLTSQVNERAARIAAEAARLQEQSDQRTIKAFNEKVRFEGVLRDAAQQRNQLEARTADIGVRSVFKQAAASREAAKVDTRAREIALRDAFRGPPPPTKGVADGAGGDAERFNSAVKSMGVSWTGLVKIFATQIAFAALGSVISQLKEGISAAKDFEIQLAQIQTISEEFTIAGLDATGEAVQRLSDRFGQPIEDVAAGLYETLSNQIGDAAEATLFLNDALVFSKASVTSAADSVDLLSGIINSYGLTAASASSISDQLFVTIDRGRVKGEELANTFGRILPLAKTLGIDLAEVNTALAELTIQGVKPSDALTQLTNVMLKLLKPTDALKAVFNELGVANAEAGIAIFGFDGFIRKVTESTKGAATEVAELFNQVRGTRGVIGIITRDQTKYAETLKEIEKAAAGSGQAQEAANKILSTNAAQLQQQITQLRNFLVNDFGRSAISVILAITDKVGGLKNAFIGFAGAVGVVGAIFAGAGITVLIGQAVSALGVLQKAIIANKIATEGATAAASRFLLVWGGAIAIAALIGTITTAMASQTDQSNQLSKAFQKNADDAEASIKAQITALGPALEARKKSVKQNIAAIAEDFRQRELLYQADKRTAFSNQADITRQLSDELSKRKSLISKALSELESIQKNGRKAQADIQKNALAGEFEQNRNKFERDIKDVEDPRLLADALLARSNKVLQAAKDAFAKGNQEFGQELLNESLDLANRAADQEGQRARGEGQINRLLNEQKSINAELIAQEEKKIQTAAAAEKATRAALLKTSSQIDEISQIDQQLIKDQPTGKPLQELLARRQELADSIQKGLVNLKPGDLSALKDLRDIFTEIKGGVNDPTTGGISSISQAFANAGKDLISTLQKQADATPLDIKIRFKALTGDELGTEGFGAGQTQAALLGTQLETNIENEKQLEVFEGRIVQANANIKSALAALTTTLQQTATQAGRFDVFGNLGKGSVKAEAEFQAKANGIRNSILEILNVASRAAQSGDIDLLDKKLAELQAITDSANSQTGFAAFGGKLQEILGPLLGGTSAGQNIKTTIDALKANLVELSKAQAGLTEGTQKSGLSQSLEAAVNEQNSRALAILANINKQKDAVAGGLGAIAPAAQTAVQASNQAFNAFSTQSAQTEIDELLAKLAQLATAQAAAKTTGTTQGKAGGGLIHYFADGGFVPRGTDTVPAMLTPGEIVMNPSASRAWYSELMAMNSGVKPIYRAEGGPVSNVTNVGDIVVNIPGQRSGRVNGRELAKELRRELRRGTIKRR